jgi:hypothetical protein
LTAAILLLAVYTRHKGIAIRKLGVLSMNLLEYYPEISSRYPAHITQKQMIEICGVCKSTAYKAERSGAVPYEKTVNRLLHTHKIRLLDALAFKYRREYGYRQDENYISYLRRFYELQLKGYPDVLSTADVSEISGFTSNSVQRWIGRGYLTTFSKGRGQGFRIPKETLIGFLVSPGYNAIQDKSEKQMAALNEFIAWYSAQTGA